MQAFTGIVTRGSGRAAALGCPTANIPLEDGAVSGIFAAKVTVGQEAYEAIAYADRKGKKLEAHLFDFDADLSGWKITVELMHKLRESRAFSGEEDERASIAKDMEAARVYFTKHRIE